MTEPDDSRPRGLVAHPEEARLACHALAHAVGELLCSVRERMSDAPELKRVDPLYAAVAKSLDNANGDGEEDVERFAAEVCAVLGRVFEGIVAIEEIDGEARAEFDRRFGGL